MDELESLKRALDAAVSRIESLADRIEATYVRRDIFDAYKELLDTKHSVVSKAQDALDKRLDEHDAEAKTRNRLVYGAFISAIGSIVVAVVLSVVLQRGGG
jgi:hypothetical protein